MTNDEKIEELTNKIDFLLKEKKLFPDPRGNWFSSSQLDALRQVYEKYGIKTAKLFQAGRINRRGRIFEQKQNEILLGILEFIEELEIDIRVGSYLLGRLNPILEKLEKRRKKNERD